MNVYSREETQRSEVHLAFVAVFRSAEGRGKSKDSIITGHLGKQRSRCCSPQKYDDGSDHFSSERKLYLVQPQLSLVHQLLHKISHKQNPGHHQHEREDKRDGLQIPGGIQRCQLSVKLPENLPSNHCQQRQMKRPIIQSRAWQRRGCRGWKSTIEVIFSLTAVLSSWHYLRKINASLFYLGSFFSPNRIRSPTHMNLALAFFSCYTAIFHGYHVRKCVVE